HAIDLSAYSRSFIRLIKSHPIQTPNIDQYLQSHVQGSRVAIDSDIFIDANRRYDDAGFSDAVTLARPYQQIIQPASADHLINLERFSASWLTAADLSRLGVSF